MDAKTKELLPLLYGKLAFQAERFTKKKWPELDQATDRVLYEEVSADIVQATHPMLPFENVIIPAYEIFHDDLMLKIASLPEADRLAISNGIVNYQTAVENFILQKCLHLDVPEQAEQPEAPAPEEEGT